MDGVAELAGTVVQAGPPGGVSLRTGVITAVNAGPPPSVDVTIGETSTPAVPYADSIATPAVNDVVMVLVTQPGGSERRGGRRHGGAVFVVGRPAV